MSCPCRFGNCIKCRTEEEHPLDCQLKDCWHHNPEKVDWEYEYFKQSLVNQINETSKKILELSDDGMVN
jgi:hypothetical protein